MGGGQSYYDRIDNQEKFVNNNLQTFKTALNQNYQSHQYKYNDDQVKGKLRQLYHNSDTSKDNERSYVNKYEWSSVKNRVVVKY